MKEVVKTDVTHDDILKYYGHDFWCPNCGKRNHRFIKKGITLDGISFDCDNCGCKIRGKSNSRLYAG